MTDNGHRGGAVAEFRVFLRDGDSVPTSPAGPSLGGAAVAVSRVRPGRAGATASAQDRPSRGAPA
ncbi:MAG: hypothetical protein ICV73_19330 [Acetobacteraceae bacterium]|nr:hypothetical protein [Acetobacteraceae bacterium]